MQMPLRWMPPQVATELRGRCQLPHSTRCLSIIGRGTVVFTILNWKLAQGAARDEASKTNLRQESRRLVRWSIAGCWHSNWGWGTTDRSHCYLMIFNRLRRVVNCAMLSLSVRREQLGSHWTVFMKFGIRVFFENLLTKIQVSLIYDRNNGCVTWRHMTRITAALRDDIWQEQRLRYVTTYDKNNGCVTWRHTDIYDKTSRNSSQNENFSQKNVAEKMTHILYSVTFSRKSCRLWDNVAKYGRAGEAKDDNMIRRMRLTCWMTRLGVGLYAHCLSCVTWPDIC